MGCKDVPSDSKQERDSSVAQNSSSQVPHLPFDLASHDPDQHPLDCVPDTAVTPSEVLRARELSRIMPLQPSTADWKKSPAARNCPLFHAPAHNTNDSCIAQLRHAWRDRLQSAKRGWRHDLLFKMKQGILPAADFQAGTLHRQVAVWEQYLRLGQLEAADYQLELDILREGVTLEWCSPNDPHKLQEPRHRQKREGVLKQLHAAGSSAQDANEAASANCVPSTVLPNMLTSPAAIRFARVQIDTNIRRGALIPWDFPGTRPHLVLPLAVVSNSAGKLRLIVDGRILNLRLRRLPFKYESAADAIRMLWDKQ